MLCLEGHVMLIVQWLFMQFTTKLLVYPPDTVLNNSRFTLSNLNPLVTSLLSPLCAATENAFVPPSMMSQKVHSVSPVCCHRKIRHRRVLSVVGDESRTHGIKPGLRALSDSDLSVRVFSPCNAQ